MIWKNPRKHPWSQLLPKPRGWLSPPRLPKGEGTATAAPSHAITHDHYQADPRGKLLWDPDWGGRLPGSLPTELTAHGGTAAMLWVSRWASSEV